MNAVLKPQHVRLPRRRPVARRLGPQGNQDRRDRDARPDGDPRRIRQEPAAEGRAHHRLAAHDDPDRRAGRDAAGARRAGALGLVQHLLHAGPRRRRAGGAVGTPVFAYKGETLADYWDYTHRIFEFGAKGAEGEGPNMILDDGGDATLLMHLGKRAEKDASLLDNPTSEEETCLFAAIKAKLAVDADLVQPQERADHRRDRRDDHRRAPPEGDERQGHADVPRHQRQRLGHQEQVRQPLRLPRIAGRLDQARDRRDDRRQGGLRGRLRRRRQGLGAGAARAVGAGLGDRDRPDQRAAGGDGRLQGRDDGVRRRQGRHLRLGHRQQERHPLRAHGGDEGRGHRLQHRPLRQRDRRRVARPVRPGTRSSRRSTTSCSPTARRSSCWPRAAW